MDNRKLLESGEADEWFKRNTSKTLENKKDKSFLCLSSWLKPFKNDINKILEVGCGRGYLLNYLSNELNAKGYGVDPSNNAINYIKKQYPSLKVKTGFADNIKIDEKFDLIHLGFFLYLVDRNMFLRSISEIDKLLKFGGFLSIIDFDTPFPYSNKYSHKDGMYSFKQNNSNVFVASGLYTVINKFHFSHKNFFFEKKINERVSLTLLYKETEIF